MGLRMGPKRMMNMGREKRGNRSHSRAESHLKWVVLEQPAVSERVVQDCELALPVDCALHNLRLKANKRKN